MTHAPAPLRPSRRPLWRARLLTELGEVLACTDPVHLDLLGDGPVTTADDARARIELLAAELVARMDRAGWDPGAAPQAVTSVLAASVPAAEDALLRVARRSVRAQRHAHRAAAR